MCARMASPSIKIPERLAVTIECTEQDSFDIDAIESITVLDGLRRCDCMKFADSTAALRYVWLDVASANRAETLRRSQLNVYHISDLITVLTQGKSWL